MLICLFWCLCAFTWVTCMFDLKRMQIFIRVHVSDKDLDNGDEHTWNAEVSVATGDRLHSERNQGNVKPSLHVCTKYSNCQLLCARFCFWGLCPYEAEQWAVVGRVWIKSSQINTVLGSQVPLLLILSGEWTSNTQGRQMGWRWRLRH